MCGFVAVLGETSRKELARALVPLAPRGPDGEGMHVEAGFGCAHRRLAVVGPDARGAQPFERDGVVVVFNGCIYNHPALRRDFEREGARFSSDTDTEILPLAWRRWGRDMPRHLEGMFAFVLWDRRAKTLFAATDAFGEKPLHLAREGGRWLFASLLTALEPLLSSRRLSPAALAELVQTMRIRAPRTVLAGVARVPAGTALVVEDGALRAWRWFRAEETKPRAFADMQEAEQAAAAALDASVAARTLADRPLGVFLSGGVDSSLVADALVRVAGRARTFSVRFADAPPGYDESAHAARVARALGAGHEILEVRADAAEALGRLAEALDQPVGNSTALPMLLLAAAARRHVVVAMHGVGGDELFGGYPRHLGLLWHLRLRRLPPVRALARLAARMPEAAAAASRRGRVQRFLATLALAPRDAYARWLGALDAPPPLVVPAGEEPAPPLPDPLAGAGGMEALVARFGPVHAAMLHDVLVYLPDDLLVVADRTTMHAGLELRAPFLHPELLAIALGCRPSWHVATRPGPWALKRLLKRLAKKRLPREVWARPKQGFMAPVPDWLRGALLPEARALVASPRLARFFDRRWIARLVAGHEAGADRADALWTLLVLDRWLEARGWA